MMPWLSMLSQQPPPGAIPDSGDDPDTVRGSVDVPLNEDGHQQAEELGRYFARRGGIDALYSSPLQRAAATADVIAKHNPNIQEGGLEEALTPWYLGGFEGRRTKEALPSIAYLIRNPDIVPPGMSPQSTKPGQSFNSFKNDTLGFVQKQMQQQAQNPSRRAVLMTHYRDMKAIEAWLEHGGGTGLDVDVPTLLHDNKSPGDIYRLAPRRSGRWEMTQEQADDTSPLLPGIYLVRHGMTDWNRRRGVTA